MVWGSAPEKKNRQESFPRSANAIGVVENQLREVKGQGGTSEDILSIALLQTVLVTEEKDGGLSYRVGEKGRVIGRF